ncbi:MAG: protein NO VEIN domain-containing protein [Nanopusillaceae archaeon]
MFERKTLKIAINEELKENRKPEIASIGEPYDIISYGNSSNDIRYIEVKGHKSFLTLNEIRLTKREFNIAKEYGNKYWIYSIAFTPSENKIIKIQNPIEKLKWETVKKKGKISKYYSHIPLNEIINEGNINGNSFKRENNFNR